MSVRPVPARPRRLRDGADVVTVDAIRHYLAMISTERGAELSGPWTLRMACGLQVAVTAFSMSTREQPSCSGCAQVGPPL